MSEKTMDEKLFRPGKYQHYKGPYYSALMLVAHHETREPMVVYVSLELGSANVRELRQPDYRTLPAEHRRYVEDDGYRLAAIDAWTDVVEWQVPMPNGSPATMGPRFVFVEDFK